MKRKINEEKLNKIISESIKRNLKEYFYFPTNGDTSDNGEVTSNDNEPLDYTQAIGDLQYICNKYGLKFHSLPDEGKEVFAVTSRLNDTGNAEGNIKEFLSYIKKYENMGRVEEIGGGVLKNGVWYRKYRITSELYENNALNA